MKDTRRKFVLFSFYDRTGIEQFLEKEAANGWLLEKMSAFGWKFRRIEPKKLHFAVTYFPKASAFDPGPSESQMSFQEFCEHTGWKLAASSAQTQIFYNEREKSIPIETDPEIELENIHASAKKTYLPSYFMQFFLGILQMLLLIQRIGYDPIYQLADTATLFSGLCWIFVILISGSDIVGYYRWRKKAKAAAEDGEFLETRGNSYFQLFSVTMMLLALGFMLISLGSVHITIVAILTILFILAITVVVVGFSEWMKRKNVKAKVNRNITFVLTVVLSLGLTAGLLLVVIENISSFVPEKEPVKTYEYQGRTFKIYHDEIPLVIENLIDTTYEDYSYEEEKSNESLILSQYEASQRPRWDDLELPELNYTIVTVKVPFLYDWCKNIMIEVFAHNYAYPEPEEEEWEKHVEVDAAPWGAKAAYQLYLGGAPEERYLLYYDDRIVEVDFSWNVTKMQMKIVGEKLGVK